ncbi:MAG: DUF1631 family protein [Curvibacter sp.]|nr:MAG: DUF1631 family protein [Curvibacter sp.]
MTVRPSPYAELYRSTLEDAASSGQAIMGKMVMAVRKSLQDRLSTSRDLRERDVHEASLKLLHAHELALGQQYPPALLAAFHGTVQSAKAAVPRMAELQFDQLELMDEAQVQESVNMARSQQLALLAAEVSLAELNPLICAALGLATVRPDHNPLRPDVYLQALKTVVERASVPASVRLDWLTTMGMALGGELRELYARLATRLRVQGVVAVGFSVVPSPGSANVGKPGATRSHGAPGSAERDAVVAAELQTRHRADPALLTLDRLRKLLAGELAPQGSPPRLAAFAQQFAREFEGQEMLVQSPQDGGFAATVPAALDALTEMKQVDHMVQRIEQRRDLPAGKASASSVQKACDAIRRSATGVAQLLSLEVINLMVDNIAHDPRLLAPVQALVRSLEPALMQLALVDPRLFTDKQHAARCLVQEVAHRSMAFASEKTTGFPEFYQEVRQCLLPLSEMTVHGPEPFGAVLLQLRAAWAAAEQAQEASRTLAVQALQHIEQRNLLAEKIAREIDSHPDAAEVPEVVIAFLCGPWAQVVAEARLKAGLGASAADKYKALISAMLWSAHPALARTNISKLTRLVPLLISTLREGLESISYPSTKTSVFLEALMALHQQVFQLAKSEPLPRPVEVTAPMRKLRPLEDGELWIAPDEARDSNFIEFPELPVAMAPEPATTQSPAPLPDVEPTAPTAHALVGDGGLPLGSWVELMTKGEWLRTQLTWASPHGSLFLFTSIYGGTQSMTRRTYDKLVAGDQLRLVSVVPVVDAALDAVAQHAMRNSLDSTP